jgi:hypothetical protein
MLKEDKEKMIGEMTENSKIMEDDLLNALSSDELKQ